MENREEVNHDNRREDEEVELEEDIEEDDGTCSEDSSSNMGTEDQYRSSECQLDMAQEQ